jgi:hypothetical protein
MLQSAVRFQAVIYLSAVKCYSSVVTVFCTLIVHVPPSYWLWLDVL